MRRARYPLGMRANPQTAAATRLFGRAMAGLALVVLAGTVGFWFLEGGSLIDALYFTVVTVSTVGFGDTVPQSQVGKVFTISLIGCGYGFVIYTIALFTELAVSGDLGRLLGRSRMKREIQALKDHMIVCGYGSIGKMVTDELERLGISFAVIERNLGRAKEVEQAGFLVVQGDATEDDNLRAAGIERAECLLACTPSDACNVYITLSARQMRPEVRIISRADGPTAEAKLKLAGADRVISPNMTAAVRMALAATHPVVEDFLRIGRGAMGGLFIDEVRLPQGCSLLGQPLAEVDLRRRFGVVVVGIIRPNGQEPLLNPGGEAQLEAEDLAICLGTRAALDDLSKEVARSAADVAK